MGLLSWFFPSDEDRIANARKLMEREAWADARLEVLSIDTGEARSIVDDCEQRLALLNLDAAVSWARAGDDRRVQLHLELADQFKKPAIAEMFKNARREMREIRRERRAEEQRAREEAEARLMNVDPMGFQGGPSLLDPQIPSDLYGPDAHEVKARLALVVEAYPSQLKTAVADLGAPFGRAILDLDDGRPDLALQALLALPDDQPLVHWERARAAYALGDPAATARALRAFAEHAGGHFPIANQHSATFLAQTLAETGEVHQALRVLRDARAKEPEVGGPLFANLLEATGELEEAETVLRALIKKYPGTTGLYAMLARVRVRGGYRVEAMQALEKAVEICDCPPGKCGYRPPDPDVLRSLAVLYLEDGLETQRALELADKVRSIVQKPGWEDAYLEALVARERQQPNARMLADRLYEHTPPGDPRTERLKKFLAA